MYEDGTTTVIEEIKGTYRDLETMEGPVPVHLAQAKCYAYIYGLQNRKEEMGVLMTYTLLSSRGGRPSAPAHQRRGKAGALQLAHPPFSADVQAPGTGAVVR